MPSTKRALLIASPYQGLRGPLSDVKIMAEILETQGFQVSSCCGEIATRQAILDAWCRIIDLAASDDTIVIYYSGHGGIVEDPIMGAEAKNGLPQPWRQQFLVPMDFCQTPQLDGENSHVNTKPEENPPFKGILTDEINYLLRKTTRITPNVTIILDCCHSERMARDPSLPDGAMPRSLPVVQYASLSRHIAHLRATEKLPAETDPILNGDCCAVRIASAASTETAWEHRVQGNRSLGAMTQALSSALKDAWAEESGVSAKVSPRKGGQISWRTMLLRVRELVNINYPHQNPSVLGPDTRLIFSLDKSRTDACILQKRGDVGILKAGRVDGVREGNEYDIMPFGTEKPSVESQIGTAIVKQVGGLASLTELSLFPGKGPIPGEGVLAFLAKESLSRLPVACPEDLHQIRRAIDKSTHLRHEDDEEPAGPLLSFQRYGQIVALRSNRGSLLAYPQILENNLDASEFLVERAEEVCKAQHLRTLSSEGQADKLEHRLAVTFGTVNNFEKDRTIEQDGSGYVIENDQVYILLENKGDERIYVSVFSINAAGEISLVSDGFSGGIDLPPGRSHVCGTGQFEILDGLPVTWPTGVPKVRPIDEHLVFIVTDSAVDLRHLRSSSDIRGDIGSSSLEQLAFRFATGAKRNIGRDRSTRTTRYSTANISYTLMPLATEDASDLLVSFPDLDREQKFSAEELPSPEELSSPEKIVDGQTIEKQGRGTIGALIRTAMGIPPYVRVVNEHDEDILVVVSKYRPNQMLSSAGINVSATGMGVTFDSTSFLSPACKKPLAGRAEGRQKSTGSFPLWTREEGFGVISIFRGPQKELCIENDQIPLGATAFFSGQPNLRMIDFRGVEIPSGIQTQLQ